MASYAKVVLTGSTNGRNIKVAATATPGTLIHTAHATAIDEIWLTCTNTDTVDRTLVLEWGGVTSPDDTSQFIIPAGDTIQVVAGDVLTGAVALRAFCAAAANKLLLKGFVNRIS